MGRGIMKWSKWSGEQNMGLPQVRGRWKESAHWSYLISPTWLSTIIRWSCSTTVVTFRKGWRSSKRGLAWPWCTSIHYQAVYGGMKRWCSWWRTVALSIPAWGWSRRAIDVGVDELLAKNTARQPAGVRGGARAECDRFTRRKGNHWPFRGVGGIS